MMITQDECQLFLFRYEYIMQQYTAVVWRRARTQSFSNLQVEWELEKTKASKHTSFQHFVAGYWHTSLLRLAESKKKHSDFGSSHQHVVAFWFADKTVNVSKTRDVSLKRLLKVYNWIIYSFNIQLNIIYWNIPVKNILSWHSSGIFVSNN